jgi:hypothetical protein
MLEAMIHIKIKRRHASTQINCFIPEDTHLTYDVDYTLELIDGNRHLVPKNPHATMSPSRMHVEQSGLFGGNEMLGKLSGADAG